jgi:hypothetical protein
MGVLMDVLTFYAPDGAHIPNPSCEMLHEFIFEKGHDYYAQGWGGGALEIMRHRVDAIEKLNDQPTLEFFFVEPHGFFFRYYSVQGPVLVTYDGSGCERLCEHYYGGDPMRIPTACFVSRECAWEIIQEFCRSGSYSPLAHWVPDGVLQFNWGPD